MILLNQRRIGNFVLQCSSLISTFPFACFSQQSRSQVIKPAWKTAQALHKPLDYDATILKKLSNLNDIKRFNNYLDNILIHRPVGSENHKKVGLYIKKILEKLGYKIEFDEFSQNTIVGEKTFRNIIATLDPLAPRRLILACHYESKDFRPNFEFLGATDSAVPCALMLDIAQSLHDFITNRTPPDLTLQLIFFDGEESFRDLTPSDSLYGSRHLAELWENQPYPSDNVYGTTELDRIDVFVLLDLLGASNPVIRNYVDTNYRPVYQCLADTERKLLQIPGCLNNSIPTIFGIANTWGTVDDDHTPFHKRGVNIVHVVPLPFPSVWHTKDDDKSALHQPTIENLATILRVFTARYLGIRL